MYIAVKEYLYFPQAKDVSKEIIFQLTPKNKAYMPSISNF